MKRNAIGTKTFRTLPPLASRVLLGLGVVAAALAACGGDDEEDGPMATAGSGGMGMGGMGGMPMAGSGGLAMAGSGGLQMTGSALMPGVLGGEVEVLAGGDEFLTATTGAISGNNVWVAIGQLTQRGPEGAPELPFTVQPVSLVDGALGQQLELPSDTFFPEGVATSADGTLFVGSIDDAAIYRLVPGESAVEAFVPAGTLAERGVLGMTVGGGGPEGILWFCDSSPALVDSTALVGVNIATGQEVGRHSLPPGPGGSVICNDVIQVNNDLLITDSFGGRIFKVASADRISSSDAEVWLQSEALAPGGNGFGTNGLTEVGEDGWVVMSNNDSGRLYRVRADSENPSAEIEEIPLMENGVESTLCGPDGLSTVPGSMQIIVVENGFCEAAVSRVSRVNLSF